MNILYSVIAVFVGSGLGGVCRWALATWCNTNHPIGTFIANILGCFFIGLFSRVLPVNDPLRLLLIAGFCGGFTTFSTFINENLLMMRSGQLVYALLYATLSILSGLLAAWAGYNFRIR